MPHEPVTQKRTLEILESRGFERRVEVSCKVRGPVPFFKHGALRHIVDGLSVRPVFGIDACVERSAADRPCHVVIYLLLLVDRPEFVHDFMDLRHERCIGPDLGVFFMQDVVSESQNRPRMVEIQQRSEEQHGLGRKRFGMDRGGLKQDMADFI